MNTLMKALIASDMPMAADREQYLGYARNVRAGHHAGLEITGNAFNVKFSREAVRIESLWDPDLEPEQLPLDEFVRIITGWPAD